MIFAFMEKLKKIKKLAEIFFSQFFIQSISFKYLNAL